MQNHPINTASSTQFVSRTYRGLTPDQAGGFVLTVLIEQENDQFFATVIQPQGIDLYGEGANQDDAVKDLLICMLETYSDFKERKEQLGPALQAQLNILQEIFREIKQYNQSGSTSIEWYAA